VRHLAAHGPDRVKLLVGDVASRKHGSPEWFGRFSPAVLG
jgi:hypothetical protein